MHWSDGCSQVYELFHYFRKKIPAFKDARILQSGYVGVRESGRVMGKYVLTRQDFSYMYCDRAGSRSSGIGISGECRRRDISKKGQRGTCTSECNYSIRDKESYHMLVVWLFILESGKMGICNEFQLTFKGTVYCMVHISML